MPFAKRSSAGYVTNHLARLFAQRLAEAIAPLGLSPGVFPALLELWEQDGRTQAELARALDIEQPTMAATLDRMERDGLIRREPDPEDGRRRRVLLTQKARALRVPATEAAGRENARATKGFSDGDAEQLLALMHRAIANLKAGGDGAIDTGPPMEGKRGRT